MKRGPGREQRRREGILPTITTLSLIKQTTKTATTTCSGVDDVEGEPTPG